MNQHYPRVDILGCPFNAVSLSETASEIASAVQNGGSLHIVTANVDFIMFARRDADFREEVYRASLVVADGVPVLWAAKLFGEPLRGRVNGTELVLECVKISQSGNVPVAMIGGDFELTRRAAEALNRDYPGAILEPIQTPFPLDGAANEELVARIRDIGAKIVLVALGMPKQERWIQAYLDACGANVGIGIGSAFDQLSGSKPRAPVWMRNSGLEWFHRMLLEPRRLGKRYLVDDMPIVWHVLVEYGKRRLKMK